MNCKKDIRIKIHGEAHVVKTNLIVMPCCDLINTPYTLLLL